MTLGEIGRTEETKDDERLDVWGKGTSQVECQRNEVRDMVDPSPTVHLRYWSEDQWLARGSLSFVVQNAKIDTHSDGKRDKEDGQGQCNEGPVGDPILPRNLR